MGPRTARPASIPHSPFRIPHLALLALLAFPLNGRADAPVIEQVRIGLPSGQGAQELGRSRTGAWAPVYVKLKAGKEGNGLGAYRVAVETTDGEGAPYRYATEVPALVAGDERLVVGYVRPGGDSGDFVVKLQTADGRDVQALPKISRNPAQEVVNPRDLLFLTVGSRLPGLTRASVLLDQAAQAKGNKNADEEDNDLEERGARRVAVLDSVAALPDHWFGYEAVDVIVLATGGDTFITQLLQESEAAKRNALLEWVRRGGKLIVSVGRNQQLVTRLFERMPLLDCPIKGAVTRQALPEMARWAQRPGDRPPLGRVEMARLAPGRGAHVVLREPAGDGERDDTPVVVDGSCGLGRVRLVAFDLDTPPFSTWEPAGQTAFWRALLARFSPTMSRPNPNKQGFGREVPELADELKRGRETFESVPVISFGWVALFILFYILLVGPLDYFILKKVFKRLELTWVTFPAVVIVVSVAAYFTAYALKGDDLRVNKVDLVEFDLHEPRQAYGTSWFTLFSPRIQSYAVGVEPAAPAWTGPPPGGAPTWSATVATMESAEVLLRTGSQGLFRRPYEYAPDAAGLERVPIPVWATRTFTASWRAPLSADQPPIEADLRRSQLDPGVLKGKVVNRLPTELQNVTLLYRGKAHSLGTLVPGEGKPVGQLFEGVGGGVPLPSWLPDKSPNSSLMPQAVLSPTGHGPGQGAFSLTAAPLMKPLMFYRGSDDQAHFNSGLRTFDQSWRLQQQPTHPAGGAAYRDEVILVARTALLSDRAGPVEESGVSPTRLWLGALPGPGRERPALPGYLNQETYVRAYIPVAGSD
jgi:hypothetical protein